MIARSPSMRSGRAPISRALKFTWNADLLKVRGELRLDDGDIAGVVHDADAMLKLQPANVNDYANALADLDKSIEADGKDATALGVRGQVYLARSDDARALSDLDRAVALGTISAAPYRARAAIYEKKGEAAKALANLNEGLARAPGNLAEVLARAQIKQGTGDARGTIVDYDAVLKKAPKNLVALRARAATLIAIKDYAKGAADYDRLIQLDPGEAQNDYRRGLIYEHDGALDKAIADQPLGRPLSSSQRFDEV